MSSKLAVFLAISFTWAALVGAGLFVTGTELSSLPGILVMAILYMPSPIVAAVIAERGIRRDRLRLPRRGGAAGVVRFVLTPVAAVLAFALLYVAIALVAGDLLEIPGFSGLAMTEAAIMDGAAGLLGDAAVAAAGPPPPVIVLALASVWGAVLAGWTLNGLFALGEEYGWRGLMWDELKHMGVVKANIAIGLAWGLWHAPVILQGYNYGSSAFGVPAMVLFCTGMSFILSAIRQRTESVLPVAAAHGIFNAIAPILLILVPDTVPVVTGPLGLTSALLLALVGALLWIRAPRPAQRTSATTATMPPNVTTKQHRDMR